MELAYLEQIANGINAVAEKKKAEAKSIVNQPRTVKQIDEEIRIINAQSALEKIAFNHAIILQTRLMDEVPADIYHFVIIAYDDAHIDLAKASYLGYENKSLDEFKTFLNFIRAKYKLMTKSNNSEDCEVYGIPNITLKVEHKMNLQKSVNPQLMSDYFRELDLAMLNLVADNDSKDLFEIIRKEQSFKELGLYKKEESGVVNVKAYASKIVGYCEMLKNLPKPLHDDKFHN